ncbi:hypothetical protein IJI64_03165 [Candidatus Saccharibacteria bacterium]|nr:hypothetical protein [Candidatus Saccharibacteria bacterium]
MLRPPFTKRRRIILIALIAAVAGIINAAVIFNLTHQPDYVSEAISVVNAMSPSDKTIVVENDSAKESFLNHAGDYVVYTEAEIPDSLEVFWYILSPDSPKLKNSPSIIDGYHAISEIINDHYAAFELEKL